MLEANVERGRDARKARAICAQTICVAHDAPDSVLVARRHPPVQSDSLTTRRCRYGIVKTISSLVTPREPGRNDPAAT